MNTCHLCLFFLNSLVFIFQKINCSGAQTIFEGIHKFNKPTKHLPTVTVSVLVRNKAHILPWFLYYLERLDYPKDRISLWIRSDHNQDRSTDIIEKWLSHVEHQYHSVNFKDDPSEKSFPDEKGPCHWSQRRFTHVIKLRQKALEFARSSWADYILFLDADVLLVNPRTLRSLMIEEQTVIAPMLNATASSTYSNFWCGMDRTGYYQKTKNYYQYLNRFDQGCFPVAMVHTCVLVDLRHKESAFLNYYPQPPGYNGPFDDIIIFAQSAKHHGVAMHLLNKHFYGYMLVPMDTRNSVEQEAEQFIHQKLQNIVEDSPLKKLSYIDVPSLSQNTLGFDQVYMINLVRRTDRRQRMMDCFKELGIKATIVDAVDGKKLNETYLQELGVQMLPGYADPYHGRPLTMGEIGCFLSHFFIWQDVLKHGYRNVIVFEDDIRFKCYFRSKLELVMSEIHDLNIDWELIYLGRKRLHVNEEDWVEGAERLVYPKYSYWTLSYLLKLEGAKKLLDQQPLRKLVPVDEYLPIMFDDHPENKWKVHFYPRDLLTLSAEPLLVEPMRYVGEEGYITDTEDSAVLDDATPTCTSGDSGDTSDQGKDEL